MKTINFSVVEILPALLSHEKVQTIRPIHGNPNISHSRYGVGDICSIQWKQRTSPKDSWFCSKCGVKMIPHGFDVLKNMCLCWTSGNDKWTMPMLIDTQPKIAFPKIIGTVKITDIFNVEMLKNPINGEKAIIVPDKYKFDDLWKYDGFKSLDDMMNWFDKHYDISHKTFEVRRWIWL